MPRIVISPQSNPYLNIAVENYLLSQPDNDEVVMYLWQNRRTVVIGHNQNPFAECDVERLEADGGFLMRRETGGGAVYHDLGNLNFSFVAPYHLYDLQRHYAVLQRALAHYGLQTEISGRNDLLCQGRKFSGNAFSKAKYQRLHHGTLLIRTNVDDLQKYLRVKPSKLQKHGVASVQSRVVNLSELVPEITAQNIIPLLCRSFEEEYRSTAETVPFESLAALPQVQALQNHFASAEWKYGNWRYFQAQRSASFDWGEVELSVSADHAAGIITHVQIATDSLFPDLVGQVCRRLEGASTTTPLPPPSDSPELQPIWNDICSLIY